MIAAISWVPKGASKSVPAVADPPSKQEIEEIVKSDIFKIHNGNGNDEDHNMGSDASKEDDELVNALAAADALGKASNSTKLETDGLTDALKELDMDNYDEEDDGVELFGPGLGNLYYPSNDMDPYLKNQNDDDSEEEDDITINTEDAVIICARNEDDVSHLEVWIIEDPTAGDINMYVHHDIVIPAFPLCMAWLDCPINGGEKGNFIAVGSMEPAIEIWDLDIMDEVQPSAVLGGIIEKKKAKKVQAVAWNNFSPQVLLSGSFDHSVVMKDGRVPSHGGFKWPVVADVESLAWDPHTEHSFVVSLENGMVIGFDVRAASSELSSEPKPTFTLHAHEKAVCAISYNTAVPNLLATGSMDEMVKLWNLSNQPSCIASKNPKAGAVFSISFSDDCPFSLAIGGSKGKLQTWDLLSDTAVAGRYGKYANQNKFPPS